jgi:hypothetical protein
MEAYNVRQKVFTVKEYYKSGNSVVRVKRKCCTKIALCKEQTKNIVWCLVKQLKRQIAYSISGKVMLDAHPYAHLMW